jgi:hypothetical protein
MIFNDYSPVLTVGVGMGASLVAFIIRVYYPLALEKRMDRVESFLRRQKNSPGLYINYVLANRLEDEAVIIMEQLVRKYKQETAQAPYKAAYGVYRKDMNAVRKAVHNIRFADYRAYYETILLMEDGESGQARNRLKSIKKQWMKSALLAEIELKAGRHEAAIEYAREAVNSSRGVYRYVLYKEYERSLPQVVKPLA